MKGSQIMPHALRALGAAVICVVEPDHPAEAPDSTPQPRPSSQRQRCRGLRMNPRGIEQRHARILRPDQAKRLGSYYSDTEFDLTRLNSIRNQLVEVGRSCVHPDYRNGAVITLLWAGLARYMQDRNYQYLIGCASMTMADGGHLAASLYRELSKTHLSPAEWQASPRCALPLSALNQDLKAEVPPLIKGYLRLGAMICGAPAWDPDFNTADFLVLLPMHRINQRYARHFLKIEACTN